MARKVERTRANGEWTEARYFGFIRSSLRQASRRYPPIARQALDAAKRKSESENKRLKWEYQCCVCGEWFPRKQVQVDHIIPCGSLRCWDDLTGFTQRLFTEPDNLRITCKACHQQITNDARKRKRDE